MRRLLAILGILASPSLWAVQGQASISGGRFLSPWSGYHNQWVGGDFQLRSDSDSSRTQYSLSLLARSDSPYPLLGNLEEWTYRLRSNFYVGRWIAVNETSLVSLDRSLNHRVCQNLLECSVAGPIGAHYKTSSFRLSLELLALPNLSPQPQISKEGQLSSEYRWTETPYQFVLIDGALLPLRISTSGDLNAATLLTPGLILEKDFKWGSKFRSKVLAATQRSKSPSSLRREGLLVVEENGSLIAVANSNQDIRFPWQHVFLSQNEFRLASNSSLGFQFGARWSYEDSYESVISLKRGWGSWKSYLSLGWHQQGFYDFASVTTGLSNRRGFFEGDIQTQMIFAEGAQSMLLTPKLSFWVDRQTNFFLQSFFIAADPMERLFSKVRASDSIVLGGRYVF